MYKCLHACGVSVTCKHLYNMHCTIMFIPCLRTFKAMCPCLMPRFSSPVSCTFKALIVPYSLMPGSIHLQHTVSFVSCPDSHPLFTHFHIPVSCPDSHPLSTHLQQHIVSQNHTQILIHLQHMLIPTTKKIELHKNLPFLWLLKLFHYSCKSPITHLYVGKKVAIIRESF